MRTGKDIQKMLELNGGRIKNVKLTDNYENLDTESGDSGMICDIVKCYWSNDYDCYVIIMDFEPYLAYNKSIAKPNWYDNNSNPTLTWFETNYYDKNGNDVLFDENTDIDDYFDFQEIKPFVFELNNGNTIKVDEINLDGAKIEFVNMLIELGYLQIKN
jgi:hypothetical protein